MCEIKLIVNRTPHTCPIPPVPSHEGRKDNVIHEIPTMVVDPMPESFFPHMDYVGLMGWEGREGGRAGRQA